MHQTELVNSKQAFLAHYMSVSSRRKFTRRRKQVHILWQS